MLPLTVEPSKPRLCNDDRFLNLWIEDRPFSLDSVQHLPKYVDKGFYQTVCNDKSGYDHIKLHPTSLTYFGFQWGGWFFVSECIPFGWRSSAYIYHTTGLVVSFPPLWSWNIPSSLYIDDRHNGQLSFPGVTLPSAYQTLASGDEVNFALALFLTSYILTSIGYLIGLAKSKLTPPKRGSIPWFCHRFRATGFYFVVSQKGKFSLSHQGDIAPRQLGSIYSAKAQREMHVFELGSSGCKALC